MSPFGVGLVAILLMLAALHLYWGVGGFWPGSDADSLRLRVVGTPSGAMPGLAACAAVAAALVAAAGVVLARHGFVPLGAFAWLATAGYVALILVFGLRGLAPYVTPAFSYAQGTPFFDLNRVYYAPLCLAIAAALLADFPFARAR